MLRCFTWGFVLGVIGAVACHVADLESVPPPWLIPSALATGIALESIVYGTQRLMHKQDRPIGK